MSPGKCIGAHAPYPNCFIIDKMANNESLTKELTNLLNDNIIAHNRHVRRTYRFPHIMNHSSTHDYYAQRINFELLFGYINITQSILRNIRKTTTK